MEGIPEHGPAIFQVLAFSNHLRPCHQLAQLARFDPVVLGGEIDQYGVIPETIYYHRGRQEGKGLKSGKN